MPRLEVCFLPALYSHRTIENGFITVVVDVLRATTAFCAAFDAGVESILPVASLEQLKELKNSGYLTAAEREGRKVDFADFGNSPVHFLQTDLRGKNLAYSTTNGTQAIELAKVQGNIAIACFANLNSVCSCLVNDGKDVVILCSGWKNSVSLEDSVCAGAVAELLLGIGKYKIVGDSVFMALQLWNEAKNHLQQYCSSGEHYQRLEKLKLNDDLAHCFKLDSTHVVPVWDGGKLVRKPKD
jgi:2-phosphosulfolactate phosphatase